MYYTYNIWYSLVRLLCKTFCCFIAITPWPNFLLNVEEYFCSNLDNSLLPAFYVDWKISWYTYIYINFFSSSDIFEIWAKLSTKVQKQEKWLPCNKNNNKKVFITLNPIHSLEFCKFDLLQLTWNTRKYSTPLVCKKDIWYFLSSFRKDRKRKNFKLLWCPE